jgi:hypothetical protein
MRIEPYAPGPGETCGKKLPGICQEGLVVARIVGAGWIIFLCKSCRAMALQELHSEIVLKSLPILGIVPEVS